jgi:ABC-type antimicrobial peptide transport system permease subunit
VYQNLPDNSEFKDVSFIAPWDLLVSSYDYIRNHQDDWNNNFLHIYVQINPNTDFAKVSAKIKDLKLIHVDKEYAERKPALFLESMNKWHLYSKYENGVTVTSEQMKFVWFYGIIGAFVLLLACINFMNLSTARSEKRAREVGIRKAIGSLRSQLIRQFFCESLLTALFAFAFSIVIVQIILPWFNEVADKKISILWTTPLVWVAGMVFTFITGLIAGSYPALYLSSFNPVSVLKGTFRVGRFASIPRKLLVVLQFTVSIALIIGTIIVYRQIQFAKNRPVGYSRDGLLVFQQASPDFKGKHDILENKLKATGAVAEMAESSSLVTDIGAMNGGFDWKGREPDLNIIFGTLGVSHDYGKTIGWQVVQGRDFSKDIASDSAGFVINESAAKMMGLKNPVGETIHWDTDFFDGNSFKILGVVRDMVMKSPFEPIQPTIFFLQGYKNYLFIKIDPAIGAHEALTKIESVFKELIPSVPFDYKFVDEEYATKFSAEERVGKLSGFFSILAILISCLGLFGLASFMAEQRIKEIGVRKVLGASVFNIWNLLSKEFVCLVILSCMIAIPIAYYFLYEWLQKYEYRTELSWWIFVAAGAGALTITLLTVSFQAIKAAIANPVKSLRTE